MNNSEWLEGIKAAEDNKPRLNPYDNGEDDLHKADNWYKGYDLAKIIITDLSGRKIS